MIVPSISILYLGSFIIKIFLIYLKKITLRALYFFDFLNIIKEFLVEIFLIDFQKRKPIVLLFF